MAKCNIQIAGATNFLCVTTLLCNVGTICVVVWCCVATEMSWPTIYNLKKYKTKQKSYQFYISLSENEKQKTTIPIVSPYNHSMMFGCFCIRCCRPSFGHL